MKRDPVRVKYWAGPQPRARAGLSHPHQSCLTSLTCGNKQAWDDIHCSHPCLTIHSLLPPRSKLFFSAFIPHMDYTIFFWRGEKSSEGKENHSTSAVPKDPQHRCLSWHALVKCAATPASLSTMQPTCIFTTMESTSSFSSVTAPPGVSRTAAVLCCEGASILTPWANRTQQSAGTQLAPGLRQCPALLHPCFVLSVPSLTDFVQVQWIKHFPALSGKPALHRIGHEMQSKSWQGKHEQKSLNF